MTVGELIDNLGEMDREAEVVYSARYVFGLLNVGEVRRDSLVRTVGGVSGPVEIVVLLPE
jgi:hypothetical protein